MRRILYFLVVVATLSVMFSADVFATEAGLDYLAVPESSVASEIITIFATVATSLLAVLFVATIIFVATKTKLAKDYDKKPVIPQFVAPHGVSVIAASRIYTKLMSCPVSAGLMELATKGKIKIIRRKDRPTSSQEAISYTIEIIDNRGLSEDERGVLELFFRTPNFNIGDKKSIPKKNDSHTKKAIREYSRAVGQRLINSGYLVEQPPSRRAYFTIIMIAVFVLFLSPILLCVPATRDFIATPAQFVIIVSLCSVSIILFAVILDIIYEARLSRSLTEKGLELQHYLKGLEKYIKMSEADRIKFMQSPENIGKINIDSQQEILKLYERLLPYAMIFNFEKKWAERIKACNSMLGGMASNF